MDNKIQQCQRCFSMELPSSVFCSQCAAKLNAIIYDFAAVTPTKPNRKVWIGALLILPLLFIIISNALYRSERQSQNTATDNSAQTTSVPAQTSAELASYELPANAQVIEGKVVGVHDGDTATVLDSKNQQYKIRFGGIDAPELGQDFGNKSKENLSRLIFGKTVKVVTNKTDKYGRTVGTVFLDGKDINLEQVKAGFAWHYKEYQSEQSEADRKIYSESEITAKAAKLGLWAMANPTAPWDFRHGKAVDPKFANKIFGNKNSMVYHWAGCPGFTKLSEKNRLIFDTVAAAEEAGYRAAKNCTTAAPKTSAELEGEDSESLEASTETPNDSQEYTPSNSYIYTPPATPTPEEVVTYRPAPAPTVSATVYPSYRQETTETATSGATSALCADGTLSYSANNQGTCSHHGGVNTWLNGTSNAREDSTPSYSAPRSSSSDYEYRPKTVQVRGYTRKDGTYVAPHTRSAPRRRN